jgi:hypothetical protein
VKRIFLLTLLLTAAIAGPLPFMVPGARAQVQLSHDPAMTRGAAASSVTIVEFSDYQ